MRDSLTGGDHRSGAFAQVPVGAPWNESGNGSGAGAGRVLAVDLSAGFLSRSFHKYSLVLYALNSGQRYGIVKAECCRMPRISPFLIHLSSAEEAELLRRAGKYTLSYFQVQRAKMILLAAEGLTNDEIAARLDSRREVVGRWRKRFFSDRLQGLEEQARPGRPRTCSPRPRRSG